MKTFLRLYLYDMRCSLHDLLPRFAIVGVFAALCSILVCFHISSTPSQSVRLNYAACIAAVFGGSSEFVPEHADYFTLPAAWLCNCLAIAYATLDYPSRHLSGVGQTALILSGSRWTWWLSKCAWTITCCLLCCMAVFGGCAIGALCFGTDAGLSLSKEAGNLLGFFIATASPLAEGTANIGPFLISATAALIALSLMQLVFSTLVAPYIGFVFTICILFSSAFRLSGLLIGNYLMIARSNLAIANGVDVSWGVAISCILAMASILIGGSLFNRRPVIKKGVDAT